MKDMIPLFVLVSLLDSYVIMGFKISCISVNQYNLCDWYLINKLVFCSKLPCYCP
jgi:hypothetical protein